MSATFIREQVEAAGLPPAGPNLFVALDIDGTILSHANTLSPRVRDAVHAHLSTGTRLCLATGRGIYGAREALGKLGIHEGMVVCSNGAITLDIASDEAIDVRTFDPSDEISTIYAALPDALYAVEALHEPRRLTSEFPEGELTGPYVVVPIEELAVEHATRLTVRHPGLSSAELLAAVEGTGLHGVEYAIGWTAWLDVSPHGVSKATALEELRRSYGIDERSTLAAGDGGNDVEMLQWAHLGVAMGNAPDSVKYAADMVTDSVNEDGLAKVLEALL